MFSVVKQLITGQSWLPSTVSEMGEVGKRSTVSEMGEVGKRQRGCYTKVKKNDNNIKLEETDHYTSGQTDDCTRRGETNGRDSVTENGWNNGKEDGECEPLAAAPAQAVLHNPVDRGWSWIILLCKFCSLSFLLSLIIISSARFTCSPL